MAPGEVVGQQRDVLAPLAQRRHGQRHDVEAVVEVLAEGAGARSPAPGRGWWRRSPGRRPRSSACRRRARTPAPAARAAASPAAPAAARRSRRGTRAAVGRLELARLLRDRAGEGALLVAEQLALEQRLGDRGAVDRHERPSARGLLLWSARATSSLPVPLSPVISTVESRRRHPPDPPVERPHRGAVADHVVIEVELRLQTAILVVQRLHLPRVLERRRGDRAIVISSRSCPSSNGWSGAPSPARSRRAPCRRRRAARRAPAPAAAPVVRTPTASRSTRSITGRLTCTGRAAPAARFPPTRKRCRARSPRESPRRDWPARPPR